MTKTRFLARLTALVGSAAVTLSIVMAAANYALPGDDGAPMLVKSSAAASRA